MQSDSLSFGGEFRSHAREAEHQEACLDEAIRHVRRVFLYAFLINVLFYLNDWQLYGHPYFLVGMLARTIIVGASIAGFLFVRKAGNFRHLQFVCVAWTVPVIGACAALVLPHTESALFITFILPNIFYLALPMSFLGALASGLGCSFVVLAAYILSGPLSESSVGLVFGMLTVNVVLTLVFIRTNRLRRLEWSATSAERAAKEDLSAQREILQNILKTIPTPLLILSENDGRLLDANDAARTYFGREAINEFPTIESCLDRSDAVRLAVMLEHHGRVEGFETRFHFPDGSLRNVLLAANVMKIDGDDDVVVIVFADITSHKETEAHLERLAATDPLTGLANRVKFFAIAESEIRRAERYERPVAVAMIDIDFFKRINDAYGHEAGDVALKAFADVCRTLVREQDVVARLGGEEFALLLPETDRVSAFVLVERLRSSVEDLRLDWLSTPMTVSIGVSEVVLGEISVDAALARADQALYVAKRSGRNQTVHFDYTESARSEALAG